jgi:hypothetical protein
LKIENNKKGKETNILAFKNGSERKRKGGLSMFTMLQRQTREK